MNLILYFRVENAPAVRYMRAFIIQPGTTMFLIPSLATCLTLSSIALASLSTPQDDPVALSDHELVPTRSKQSLTDQPNDPVKISLRNLACDPEAVEGEPAASPMQENFYEEAEASADDF